MKLTVTNERERPVRVIVDRDDVNDFTLDAGDTQSYDTPPDGLIGFRELGGSQGDLPGDVAT
jgi:hypothetical protein